MTQPDLSDLTAALEGLQMTDLVRLQDHLAELVCRRYSRRLALAFTDIVASTSHLMRLGEIGSYALRQRHEDLVRQVVGEQGGRLVDTAGDGSFSCFETPYQAVQAMTALQHRIRQTNAAHLNEEQVSVRAAVHWGDVLTDGHRVSGKSVHLCARLLDCAGGGRLVLSEELCRELPPVLRQLGQATASRRLKGFTERIRIVDFAWQSHVVTGCVVTSAPEQPREQEQPTVLRTVTPAEPAPAQLRLH